MSQSVREADNQLLLFYEAQLKFGFIVFLLHNYRLRPLHVGALYRMLSEGGRKEILKSNKKNILGLILSLLKKGKAGQFSSYKILSFKQIKTSLCKMKDN